MRDQTMFLALMAGAYLLATGIGFFLSTRFYEKMVAGNANTDPVTLNLSGAVHFLVGAGVLITHFHWDGVTEILVTLIGLAAAGKGAALIIVPELTLTSPKTSANMLRVSGTAFVVIGAYLLFAAITGQ